MSDTDWFWALTGAVPSEVLMQPLSLSLGVFGDWDADRIDRSLVGKLLVRNEALLTSFQRSRLKPLPADIPSARLFRVPTHECGCILAFTGSCTVLVGPFAAVGSQHKFCIERVHVFPNGITAIIAGELLSSDQEETGFVIAFHDSDFALSRGFYEKGLATTFILAGFVLEVGPSPGERLTMPRSEWAGATEIESGSDGDTVTFDMSGAAMFFPEDQCIAQYQFRGRVEAVSAMTGFEPGSGRTDQILGERVWRVKTLVCRAPDVSIDMIVTERVLGNQPELLTLGNWINGRATMTGFCCW